MRPLVRAFWRMAMRDEDAVRRLAENGHGLRQLCAKMVLLALDEATHTEDFPGQKRETNGRFGKGTMPGRKSSPEASKRGTIKKPKQRIPKDSSGRSYTMPRAGNMTGREASKIGHEINTNYAKYKGKELCLHISYNPDNGQAYNYLFENHGFGEYNFFKKVRNKR